MDCTIDEYLHKVPVYQEEDDQSPSQSELESLKTFLSGDLSVQDCAQQLARRPTQSSAPSLTRQLRMSMLWSVIHAVALKFPATQPRIVELFQEIRKSQVDEWSRLGTWGHKWADTMNSKWKISFLPSLGAATNHRHARLDCEVLYLDDREEERSGASTSDGATLWPHAVAFAARLTATGDPVLGDPVFLQRASRSIVRALDTDSIIRNPQMHRPDVLAAAQLFLLSPHELREECDAGGTVEALGNEDLQGAALLWSGDIHKLSPDRWKHWEARWRALSVENALDDEVKTVAAEVVQVVKPV